jgi:hypothetical protein
VKDKPGPDPEHGQAAELLSKWRAAGRDTVAAQSAAEVAGLALAAARAAEEAAVETEGAAQSAAEAVERALNAAAKAKKAAAAAARAAHILIAGAEGDKVRANHDVDVAQTAEDEAGKEFKQARDRGFAEGGST